MVTLHERQGFSTSAGRRSTILYAVMASASEPAIGCPPPHSANLVSIFDGAVARCDLLDSGPPKLLVAVDTEEAFDWSKPYSRSETSVEHIKYQIRAQRIFECFGVKPIYVVDYPVASQE